MLLAITGGSAAEVQWPQFRGPQAGAIPDDPALPDTWSETENIVWKTAIPGLGWSSPVVWDDHIFLTSAISEGKRSRPGARASTTSTITSRPPAPQRWMVYDIDFKTGKIRWERELKNGHPPLLRHIKNSYASETPVTDGERVYVYFGSHRPRRRARLQRQASSGRRSSARSTPRSSSAPAPRPCSTRIACIIVNDNTTQSFLIAFDKRTGNELWKVNRDEAGNWSTPFVWENDVRTEIVTTGTRQSPFVRSRRQAAVGAARACRR